MRERESCVLICENVADLIEGNFVKDFSKWVMRLSEFGFNSYDQVLNAKDYGIPQNRKRVFMVSLPGSYHYIFPRKMVLEHRLKNFLEKEVNEKYYLSEKMINYITATGTNNFSVNNSEINCKVARPLTTEQNKRAGTTNYICDDLPENCDLRYLIAINCANSKGYALATDGDGIDISGRMRFHRGTVQKGMTQTITTMGGNDVGVMEENLKIRKLTPKECMRLMGFEDKDTESMQNAGMTDSQIYHCAGDSIVVTVLMGIFGTLCGVEDYEQRIKDYANELAASK